LFNYLNVPLATDKTVGPTTQLTYLGIEIDSSKMEIRLPAEKLAAILQALPFWQNRRKATKREVLSLIGTLSFATKVVRPGRTFLRRLIDLSTKATKLHHHLDITADARKDITWWMVFLQQWNGRSLMIAQHTSTNHALQLFTDASDIGYGILFKTHWVAQQWPAHIANDLQVYNIDFRELFAIYVAVVMFATDFAGEKIVFFTDNMPITQAWQKGTSNSSLLMSLIRAILMIAASHSFSLSLQFIPGTRNEAADMLSRLELTNFRRIQPQSDANETVPPKHIWKWNQHGY
jgi:hypothetical protein